MPHRLRPLAVSTDTLVALTAIVGVLLVVRLVLAGHPGQTFLAWNVFLAWLPYVLARCLRWLDRARAPLLGLVAVGVVWLAFLPNAPYLITDVVHLAIGSMSPARLAFDTVLFALVALLGLLLGIAALDAVHDVVERRIGSVGGWTFVAVVSVVCAFGVYLGRIARWNSWNVWQDPRPLLHDVAWRLEVHHPGMTVGTLLFAACFLAAYVALRPQRRPLRRA